MTRAEKPCRHCNGTGLEPDQMEWGKAMRDRRKVAGMTQRAVADEMGISPAYLSDLEHGRRAWNSNILLAFCRVVPE